MKMYKHLRKGGKIVSVMSPHWKFANDKKSIEFRSWLETVEHHYVELPESTFKDSGTGVSSFLIAIVKG